MAKKISQLSDASSLTGAELVEVVQSGVNKKTTTQNIANRGLRYQPSLGDTTLLWRRPTLNIGGPSGFNTWLNQGNLAASAANVAPGTGYAENDVITLAGGSGASPATQVTVDTVDESGAITSSHVSEPGYYATVPSSPVSQATVSPSGGTGATWTVNYLNMATVNDTTGGSATPDPDIAPLNIIHLWATVYGDKSVVTALLTDDVPSPPWTRTLAVKPGGVSTDQSDFAHVPLILYNSGASKATFLASSFDQFFLYRSTDLTAVEFSAKTAIFSYQVTALGLSWWRVVNDGTNITLHYSNDNITYTQFYSEALADHLDTVDMIGFGDFVTHNAGGNGYIVVSLYDYR